MIVKRRQVLNRIFVVVWLKACCLLQDRSINIAYSEHPQHCLYLFQNSITIVVLRKYIGTVHNTKRRNYTYQLSLVNHRKDDSGILTESFAMGKVVK